MIIALGTYKTRSGLRAVIRSLSDDHCTGTIEGASYGQARGTSQITQWSLDGTHEFSRTDDLVCTWNEYIGRLPGEWR